MRKRRGEREAAPRSPRISHPSWRPEGGCSQSASTVITVPPSSRTRGHGEVLDPRLHRLGIDDVEGRPEGLGGGGQPLVAEGAGRDGLGMVQQPEGEVEVVDRPVGGDAAPGPGHPVIVGVRGEAVNAAAPGADRVDVTQGAGGDAFLEPSRFVPVPVLEADAQEPVGFLRGPHHLRGFRGVARQAGRWPLTAMLPQPATATRVGFMGAPQVLNASPKFDESAWLVVDPAQPSGATESAPISSRFRFAGLSSVSKGLPMAASSRANASVLLARDA